MDGAWDCLSQNDVIQVVLVWDKCSCDRVQMSKVAPVVWRSDGFKGGLRQPSMKGVRYLGHDEVIGYDMMNIVVLFHQPTLTPQEYYQSTCHRCWEIQFWLWLIPLCAASWTKKKCNLKTK
jgi:hypothetical protein